MKNGYLSLIGLVLMLPIAFMTMTGTMSPADAAVRALGLLGLLVVLDRLVAPLAVVIIDFLAVDDEAE